MEEMAGAVDIIIFYCKWLLELVKVAADGILTRRPATDISALVLFVQRRIRSFSVPLAYINEKKEGVYHDETELESLLQKQGLAGKLPEPDLKRICLSTDS